LFIIIFSLHLLKWHFYSSHLKKRKNMSSKTGEISLLDYIPTAPNTNLPLKSTDATASQTLQNISPVGDIGDNGSSIQASSVPKLYNYPYDRITSKEEVRQLRTEVTSLRTQLHTAN
jgi:hypothetical protein